MVKFFLFCILLILCWPLALLAVVLYPLVWLLLIPFRLVGIAVGGVLELIGALFSFRCECCVRSSPSSGPRHSARVTAVTGPLVRPGLAL